MLKVLLIDTEPHILSLLRPRFELEGFEVATGVSDSYLASDSAPEITADLVVLGKRGPGETRLLEHLQRSGNPHVPIILLTSSDEPLLGAETRRDIAQLKMPFRPSQLLELARKAVTNLL
jgi:DNA-binding NtrC family response regulator